MQHVLHHPAHEVWLHICCLCDGTCVCDAVNQRQHPPKTHVPIFSRQRIQVLDSHGDIMVADHHRALQHWEQLQSQRGACQHRHHALPPAGQASEHLVQQQTHGCVALRIPPQKALLTLHRCQHGSELAQYRDVRPPLGMWVQDEANVEHQRVARIRRVFQANREAKDALLPHHDRHDLLHQELLRDDILRD